jgi:hypothetical protein
MAKHIKENQRRLDFYNRMKSITDKLSGGRNSSPQNSGNAMAIIHLSRPIFRSNGNMVKNGSQADLGSVRGVENVLELINTITPEEIHYFKFMKVTEIKTYQDGFKKTLKWDWITCKNNDEVLEIINHNNSLLI